ncbi:MAG: T9SS type A sorting domain-containing protein, partial [Bacteroidota bacterium]
HYELKEPVLRVEPDTLFAFDTETFTITNEGNDEMDWIIRNANDWIVIQNDTIGLDDEDIIIDLEDATSTRSGYIYVYASESQNFIDSVFVIQEVNSGQVGQPRRPTGPSETCSSSINGYSTEELENADQYVWFLSPAESGTLSANGSRFVEIEWSDSFEGVAQLTVQGINSQNQSQVSAPAEISIYASVDPMLEVEGPDLVCEGETAIYSLVGTGLAEDSKVVWIVNNQRIDSINLDFVYRPNNNDRVRAEITNTIVCASTNYLLTEPLEISSILNGEPTVSINGDGTICPGEPVIFSLESHLGGVNPEYIWYIDGIEFSRDESIELDESYDGKLISLTMVSNQECLSNPVALSDPILIKYIPTEAPQLYLENDSIRSTRPGFDHEWTVNGLVVANYSSNVIAFDRSKEYIARSYLDDCFSEYSEPLLILGSEEDRDDFRIYPNPVVRFLNFQNQTNEKGVLSLKSILGQDIIEIEVKPHSQDQMDFSNLAPGIYVVNFKNSRLNVTQRFVKIVK